MYQRVRNLAGKWYIPYISKNVINLYLNAGSVCVIFGILWYFYGIWYFLRAHMVISISRSSIYSKAPTIIRLSHTYFLFNYSIFQNKFVHKFTAGLL